MHEIGMRDIISWKMERSHHRPLLNADGWPAISECHRGSAMAWDIKGGPWPDGSSMWCKRLRGGRFWSWKSVVFSGLGPSNQKVFATYYVHQFGHPPPNSASACALACRMDLLMIASTRYTQFRKRVSKKNHYLWLWDCFERPCVRCCHIWLTPINPGTILWW